MPMQSPAATHPTASNQPMPSSAAPAPAPAAPINPPFAGNRAASAPAPAAPQQAGRGLPPEAPKLVISGGVYSTNPAQRRLIVNGQVVTEGADLGSGVVLEQVGRDTAVLGFRGQRYNVFF